MKMQSMIVMMSILFINFISGNEGFCMISNHTSYSVDVYDFTKLDSICFAGARPVVGPEIILSHSTLPRVQEGCFSTARPLMPSIPAGSTRTIPGQKSIVLVCSNPFYFMKCLHCHNYWLGHHSAMYAYQMVNTQPGAHYFIIGPKAESIEHHRN